MFRVCKVFKVFKVFRKFRVLGAHGSVRCLGTLGCSVWGSMGWLQCLILDLEGQKRPEMQHGVRF